MKVTYMDPDADAAGFARLEQREEHRMSEAIVRFFKEGIQTTALDERDFVGGCAEGLTSMIGSGQFEGDWKVQLSFWLPQIVDIVSKLRGYKSSVYEQRVITAGDANFTNKDLIYPRDSNGSEPRGFVKTE